MKDIQFRIVQVLSYSKLNTRSFSNRIEVSYATIYGCVNFTRPANLEIIQKICYHFPEIDERWLLLGEGEMISSKTLATLKKSGQ